MSDTSSRLPKVLYGALALAVLLWLYNSWNSDERRLVRRLDALRGVVEKSRGESDLEAVHRARKLGGFFAREFRVEGAPFGVFSDRQRMGQLFVQYRRHSESIGVGLSGREVELMGTGPGKAAQVALVATLTGRTGTDFRRESYRLLFLWVEEDGEWVIERLELLEVLEGEPWFMRDPN